MGRRKSALEAANNRAVAGTRLFYIGREKPFDLKQVEEVLALSFRLGGRQVAFQPYRGEEGHCDREIRAALAPLLLERRRVKLATHVWSCWRFRLRDMYRFSTRSCSGIAELAYRLQDHLDNIAVYRLASEHFVSATIFHERMCLLQVPPKAESIIQSSGIAYLAEPPPNW